MMNMPVMELIGFGSVGSYGTPMYFEIPAMTLSTGVFPTSFVGSPGLTTLPSLRMTGAQGLLGLTPGISGDLLLPTMTLTLSGSVMYGSFVGDLSLPVATLMLSVSNSAQIILREYALYAMNMQNGSVTELPYAADSFCELNGILYAAGPAGLMMFEGSDTNNGATINSRIAKSGMNFGTALRKRITDIFIRCRTQGSFKVTSSSELVAGSVTVADKIDTLHGFKANLPRGISGQELGLAIENVDGCDFEIAEMEFDVMFSKNRHGRQARNG